LELEFIIGWEEGGERDGGKTKVKINP